MNHRETKTLSSSSLTDAVEMIADRHESRSFASDVHVFADGPHIAFLIVTFGRRQTRRTIESAANINQI